MPNARPVNIDLRRPFTRAEAIAAGVSPSSLRGPNFRQIFRGVYIHSSVPPHPILRIQAALLIHPALAFASHLSAARVYDLPIPYTAEEHVSVFAEADRRRRPEIRNHIAAEGRSVNLWRGIRVSTPDELFVELASVVGLVDLVVAGDALVRRRLTTPDELELACARSGDRSALTARRAAAFVRKDVDSPMETRLRMLLVLAGLPEPDVNHKIFDEHGRLRFRLDLSYPDLKLIVEYDGQQHRDDLDQWEHDVDRREWFDRNGWMIGPVFSRGIFRRPDKTIERVRGALELRGCSRLPRVLSDGWRPHFPVRP